MISRAPHPLRPYYRDPVTRLPFPGHIPPERLANSAARAWPLSPDRIPPLREQFRTPRRTHALTFSIRVDHRLSERDSLFVRYASRDELVEPSTLVGTAGPTSRLRQLDNQRTQSLSLHYTTSSPARRTNSVRLHRARFARRRTAATISRSTGIRASDESEVLRLPRSAHGLRQHGDGTQLPRGGPTPLPLRG